MIGIDNIVNQLRADQFIDTPLEKFHDRIHLQQRDLISDEWPFKSESVGGIINVHFLHTPLLSSFCDSLAGRGMMLVETIPGHGGNYNSLPKQGEIVRELTKDMSLIYYHERPAGPPVANAVTAKLVAMKIAVGS